VIRVPDVEIAFKDILVHCGSARMAVDLRIDVAHKVADRLTIAFEPTRANSIEIGPAKPGFGWGCGPFKYFSEARVSDRASQSGGAGGARRLSTPIIIGSAVPVSGACQSQDSPV
jgi:hypothetical protein